MKEIVIFQTDKDYEAIYEYQKGPTGVKKLIYAKGGEWTHPGKNAFTLVNTGDGLVFTDTITKKRFKIDYCQADALRFLLSIENTDTTLYHGKLEKK